MVETKLSCQYCGEKFDTKSDLQDHEMNCLSAGQSQGQKQQPQTGRQQQTAGRQQQTTGNRTRGAGSSGGGWDESGESGI
jgi:hypothetical protein